MDHFTITDWIIIGTLLVAGLAAATLKVFLLDDQDKLER